MFELNDFGSYLAKKNQCFPLIVRELLPLICRTCCFLNVFLEELGRPAVSLHSYKSQPQRLLALSRFKSGQVPVLISTDVGSRGLDIPTVDLVINYDVPRLDIPTVNHPCQHICE
jgi:Lhr-like helicase